MGDQRIVERCKNAYANYSQGTVIDLDKIPVNTCKYQIYRLETLIKEFKGTIPPNRRSEFIISLLKRGSGKRSIACSQFNLKDNTLSIVPPRAIMSSTYDSLDVEGYVLMVNVDLFLEHSIPFHFILNRRIFKPTSKRFVVLNDTETQKIGKLFEDILGEHENRLPLYREMLVTKISELLILCDRYVVDDDGKPFYRVLVDRFTKEIEQHFSKQKKVRFYSSILNVHPNYLNYQVKKHTGITAKETINNRVILEAKYLLYSTDFTIKEIAFELGFEDPNYFISFFKKGEGITPTRFRSNSLGRREKL